MKQSLGAVNALYPMPTVILGAYVQDKANFITIAHVGVATRREPECITFGVNRAHYTNQGIKQNKAFSVNLAGEAQMREADYCGIVSGRNTDKTLVLRAAECQKVNAPYAPDCPVVMECELYSVVEFPEHDLFVGRIVETRAEESVLSDGAVDIAKLRPLLFDMASKKYWGLGQSLGDCWQEGLKLKREA